MKPSQDVIDAQLKLAIERMFNFERKYSNKEYSLKFTKDWFLIPCYNLNNCTPLQYIQNGQAQRVFNLIDDIEVFFTIP